MIRFAWVYAVGKRGAFAYTEDAGRTWATGDTGTTQDLYAVSPRAGDRSPARAASRGLRARGSAGGKGSAGCGGSPAAAAPKSATSQPWRTICPNSLFSNMRAGCCCYSCGCSVPLAAGNQVVSPSARWRLRGALLT